MARGSIRGGGAIVEAIPLADGGEGTAAALQASLGGSYVEAPVSDPLGRKVRARILFLPDGRAVIEAAEAIGFSRLAEAERDPLLATSRGVGELILAAVKEGAGEIVVAIGGTTTVDGGRGLLDALDRRAPAGVRLVAALDVRNPLLGERGAARAFGPQKGATPEGVAELERRIAAMAELRPYADVPGAGAGGGLGAALAFLGAEIVSGAEFVLAAVELEERLGGAQLVVTGEGQIDRTSCEGKLPVVVAGLCRKRGVPAVLFGGRITEEGRRGALDAGATAVLPLGGEVTTAARDLEALGEALASIVTACAQPAGQQAGVSIWPGLSRWRGNRAQRRYVRRTKAAAAAPSWPTPGRSGESGPAEL
jgi:glycerate kinase